jgi:hypothetical protein
MASMTQSVGITLINPRTTPGGSNVPETSRLNLPRFELSGGRHHGTITRQVAAILSHCERRIMLHVYMAVFWFVLGAVILVVHATSPEAPMRSIGDTGVSPGWFCIALGLFNTLRFWTNRYFAVVLFIVGCGLIVYHYADSDAAARLGIGATGISPGWFLILLAGYILLRSLTNRKAAGHCDVEESSLQRHVERRRSGMPDTCEPEYHPELDFSNRPTAGNAATNRGKDDQSLREEGGFR